MPPEQDQALADRAAAWMAAYHGSLPEFIVWDWLVGTKKQRPGVDFIYQDPFMGGRTSFGGFVVDYYFPPQQMGWNVQGLRWHWSNPNDRARDMIAKQLLAGRGINLLFLWEDSLLTRPDLVLEKAWRGEEVDTWRNG